MAAVKNYTTKLGYHFNVVAIVLIHTCTPRHLPLSPSVWGGWHGLPSNLQEVVLCSVDESLCRRGITDALLSALITVLGEHFN